jgi:Tat protein translocase TatC
MWQGILKKVFSVREKVALNLSGDTDQEKPFLDHLEDLRTMIVRIVTTLLVVMIGAFCFYDLIFDFIKQPLWISGIVKTEEELANMMKFMGPTDGFMMTMNLTLITAVLLSFPLLMYFILQFILPGLKPEEKKVLWPAMGIGSGLFLIGAAFSYFVVLPRALEFFHTFNKDLGFMNDWRVDTYTKFASRFVLLFGIAFELPVVVMGLVKLDFLNYKLMSTTRRYAIVVIAIFAAVVTPTPDPGTMLIMAGPLYILYEICIFLAKMIEKKDREAYPEYYAQIEKDEKELEKVKDDWDNEDYNPWSTADDSDDDLKDEYQKPAATPSAPPPEVEKNPDVAAVDDWESNQGEDQSSVMPEDDDLPPTPGSEKTTEDLAREDEERSSKQ